MRENYPTLCCLRKRESENQKNISKRYNTATRPSLFEMIVLCLLIKNELVYYQKYAPPPISDPLFHAPPLPTAVPSVAPSLRN